MGFGSQDVFDKLDMDMMEAWRSDEANWDKRKIEVKWALDHQYMCVIFESIMWHLKIHRRIYNQLKRKWLIMLLWNFNWNWSHHFSRRLWERIQFVNKNKKGCCTQALATVNKTMVWYERHPPCLCDCPTKVLSPAESHRTTARLCMCSKSNFILFTRLISAGKFSVCPCIKLGLVVLQVLLSHCRTF